MIGLQDEMICMITYVDWKIMPLKEMEESFMFGVGHEFLICLIFSSIRLNNTKLLLCDMVRYQVICYLILTQA